MIDTRNKRASAMNQRCPWRRHRPLPDGTVDAPDRKHLALLYSGIAANVTAHDHVCGRVTVRPLVSGTVSVEPLVRGRVSVQPLIKGTILINPC